VIRSADDQLLAFEADGLGRLEPVADDIGGEFALRRIEDALPSFLG
jgi:hypothetical protein